MASIIIDHVTEMSNEFLGKLFRSSLILSLIFFFFLEFHIDEENISREFRFLLFVCYSILIFS